ncbi:hypothetical protein L596_013336 [Steinernema carpocapsae]|uniref:Uncharacterized protein n=1 Tax=Steinernema carpocapsae TaxID=34508 RepID=A0A4U5NZV6_STECR|nr:hypothetical protein L596_013336 [Steinernema carpocapsae]
MQKHAKIQIVRERPRRPIRVAEKEVYVRRPPAASTRHHGCLRKDGRAPYKATTSVTCRSLRNVFNYEATKPSQAQNLYEQCIRTHLLQVA